jgi:hypothetical protein
MLISNFLGQNIEIKKNVVILKESGLGLGLGLGLR